jgi:hypothetical protein
MKWKESLDDVRFESKETVMEYIHKDQVRDRKWMECVKDLLNFELEIPIAPLVATALGFVLILAVQIKPLEEPDYAYTIITVNQWGQYENY